MILPDLIGRIIDVEQPPYDHQGPGMQCVLWDVKIHNNEVEVVGTEGYGWLMDDQTLVTVIDPTYQNDEMAWRANL